MRAPKGARCALVALGLWALTGCTPGTPGGALGEERFAYFIPEREQVFTERLMTGSRFTLEVKARSEQDTALIAEAALGSSDPEILAVSPADPPAGGFAVEVIGSGEAHLTLAGQEGVLDRILVRAAPAATLELLDGKLLGTNVDARLPGALGLVEGTETFFGVAATDQCGGPLLSLGAVTLSASEPERLAIESGDGVVFDAEALVPGELELRIEPVLGGSKTFEVEVVTADDVDDVVLEVAAAGENQAQLWGRGYAGNLELIGLEYRWDATPRVSLSPARGPASVATISVPPEGAPPDDRPAVVDVEAHGEADSLDLFTLRTDQLVASRLPQVLEEPSLTLPSCGGQACDPYQASLLGTLALLRVPRRRRPAR